MADPIIPPLDSSDPIHEVVARMRSMWAEMYPDKKVVSFIVWGVEGESFTREGEDITFRNHGRIHLTGNGGREVIHFLLDHAHRAVAARQPDYRVEKPS